MRRRLISLTSNAGHMGLWKKQHLNCNHLLTARSYKAKEGGL